MILDNEAQQYIRIEELETYNEVLREDLADLREKYRDLWQTHMKAIKILEEVQQVMKGNK